MGIHIHRFWWFQINSIKIVTLIKAYIFFHHNGQFFHVNPPPKLQVDFGEKLFVNANHELTYDLESSSSNAEKENCANSNNNLLDNCIYKVSS